jgi:aerobic carbon-monoxide dehydrogenase medium subunit
MTQSTEVLIPTSPDEAAAAFGDGSGVTVVGGGTIVMPEITYGRLSVEKAVLLAKAGLSGVTRDGSTITVGAATPVADLVDLPAPLGPCAANVADGEIRAQATLGGNVCAGPGPDAPRGDLQGPLLALGAVARSTGAGGERSNPLEGFLDDHAGRLLLDVSFEEPSAGAFAAIDYPHTHEYTVLAVSGARTADGTVRLAATGLADHARLLPDDPAAAAAAVRLGDDALASAWYREQTLPVLMRRVLADLEEAS